MRKAVQNRKNTSSHVIGVRPAPGRSHHEARTSGHWTSEMPSQNMFRLAPQTQTGSIVQIPQNNFDSIPWFHGNISLAKAEELVLPLATGLFLVKQSSNSPGDLTLYVAKEGGLMIAPIHLRKGVLFIEPRRGFHSLQELIQFYAELRLGEKSQLQDFRPTIPVIRSNFVASSVIPVQFGPGTRWHLELKHLLITKSLEKETSYELFQGTYQLGEVAAIKLLTDRKSWQTAFFEAGMMVTLDHKNVLRLMGFASSVSQREVYMVTELLHHNLLNILLYQGRKFISRQDLVQFALDTCTAMVYLKTKDFVHKSLCASSVRVRVDHKNNTAKLSNFDLTKVGDVLRPKTPILVRWTAPEVQKGHKYLSKSDVWSFGVFLWEMYSFGKTPFPRKRNEEVLKAVEAGYVMEPEEFCTPEIYDLMKQTWALDPEQRPDFPSLHKRLCELKDGPPPPPRPCHPPPPKPTPSASHIKKRKSETLETCQIREKSFTLEKPYAQGKFSAKNSKKKQEHFATFQDD